MSIPSLVAPGLLVLAATLPGAAFAQVTPSDEQFFRDLAETRNFTLGIPVSPKLTPDGNSVVFLRSGPRDPVLRLYELDVATGREREVLSPERILQSGEEQLSAEEKARRERQRQSLRGFTAYQLTQDGARILLNLGGKIYIATRADGSFVEMPGSGWIAPQLSPDGRFVGAVRGHELFVIEIATRTEHQLTSGATESVHHGVAEFVAQEEFYRFDGFWWSPDSQSLVYQETDHAGVEIRHIGDPLNPSQSPAKNFYPRPGTANATVRLGIISRAGGPTTWIDWNRGKFPYVARVDWKEARAPLTIYVLDRVQQNAELLAVDPQTGRTAMLLRESDPAWLNVNQDTRPVWLEDGSAFLWASESPGYLRLELRGRDGVLTKALTQESEGFAVLIGLVGDPPDASRAVIAGGPDPKELQLFAIALNSTVPTALSSGSGVHSAALTDGTSRWLHLRELVDGTMAWEVREASGKVLAALTSVAESPPALPRLEFVRVNDGREYEGYVIRPRHFQPGVKYPVLLEVYAGPHAQQVRAVARRYLVSQWYADQGYLVVGFDGRGTPRKGRAWERAIRGNFIDIALNDQIAALRAAAKLVPEMDLSRVGVSGWSFGGYFSAMAVMRRPDVFQVGVAGAPVITWENYDTAYTERYLGLPQDNPEGYRVSSVLTYVSELRRPLLLIHGATDDNVYFQHSVQLADALYRAGKYFEFLPLLGTHMVADPLTRLRRDLRVVEFFNRHLKPEPKAR